MNGIIILFSSRPYWLEARKHDGRGSQSRLLKASLNIFASKANLVQRRSANYHPSIWNHELIESLSTPYQYELYGNRSEELKEETRKLLASTNESCERLKLIDLVQRLGVAYHFEEEIKEALNLHLKDVMINRDLHATALQFRLLREHGHSIRSVIARPKIFLTYSYWTNLCGSYMVEARWFSRGYTPTVKEYLENGWISVGGPAAIVHAYLLQLQGCNLTNISLDCLKHGSDLIYWSSIITRLADDLGTSTDEIKRGDVAKTIQCYMNEKCVSEEEARDHIKWLISNSWKEVNEINIKQKTNNLPKSMVKMCLNMARTAQCLFQHGDGIGTSIGVTRDRLLATSSSLNFSSPKFIQLYKTRILLSSRPYNWLEARKHGGCGHRSRLLRASLNIFASKANLVKRRSANYHPSIWNHELIESLSTPYQYELYGNRSEELKEETRKLLASTNESCERLKLIDLVQRLGVAYHFEEEIKEALNLHLKDVMINRDLHATALQFRLLREHGHSIRSDVFDKFRDRDGRFSDNIKGDIAGVLSLYEASFLGIQGENVLEEARSFSTKHLKKLSGNNKLEISEIVSEQVQQSLEIPLHWRMPRVEALNFINLYTTDHGDDHNSLVLLELAKLDYNLVQSIHQQELKELSRWWSQLGFKENLSFSRDRLMENYLWAMGINFEPQFSKYRIGLTKFVCILTAIDDMYDVYGSPDELELFTNAVKSWDVRAMEDLPDYMKICYFAMFNFANALAFDVLNHHGLNVMSEIRTEWTNLCGSYMVEARWFSRGYTPTVKEYLENSWITVGGPAAIVHAYLLQLQGCNLTNNSLDCLKLGSDLIYWSSIITRLADDLGTSTDEIKRGDVAKIIQCYMNEEGVSEEEARDRIKGLIGNSWKKVNEIKIKKNNDLPKSMVKMCLNMARTAQCLFQHGDGIGTSIGVTRDRLVSLILKAVPIK
ncbi:hypothetical protein Dsin_031589 [Dipteronia sinensis]|uniref:Uncharacterized protein n=1 Tax=Dipteronia sinensis TaxID=43782 RepID=A0AAD9ZM71_9ROSI|nr:hypothetical protein Dsin_031589 [Dipteronia sinensis]